MSSQRRSTLAGLPLREIVPADEFLHPVGPDAPFEATETSYFGFNIPEHRINGEIYVWFHPALPVMSASIVIWQGMKATHLSAEYVNNFTYLPYLEGDIGSYTIEPLGMSIEVIDPLRTIRITCHDEARGMHLSLLNEAIMVPGGRPNGGHFTQPMHTTGSLELKGETYAIDSYFSRDRSWSAPRPETSRLMPPIQWMVGVFDDDFAFHAVGFEDPARDPVWKDVYPIADNLTWGYVWRDGQVIPLERCSNVTRRAADGISTVGVEMTLTEVGGREHEITGTIEARLPWSTWTNMITYFCMTRWETAGRTGWGDTQDIQFHDFQHRFHRAG